MVNVEWGGTDLCEGITPRSVTIGFEPLLVDTYTREGRSPRYMPRDPSQCADHEYGTTSQRAVPVREESLGKYSSPASTGHSTPPLGGTHTHARA